MLVVQGHRAGHCASCGAYQVLQARGLDGACYQRHKHAGTLAQFPLRRRPAVPYAELARVVTEGRRLGWTRAEQRERLGGMPEATFHAAKREARRRGLLPYVDGQYPRTDGYRPRPDDE